MNFKHLTLMAMLGLAGAPALVAEKYQDKTWMQFCEETQLDNTILTLNVQLFKYQNNVVVGEYRLDGLAEDLATVTGIIAQVKEFIADHASDTGALDYRTATAQLTAWKERKQALETVLREGYDWVSLVPSLPSLPSTKQAVAATGALATAGAGYYGRAQLARGVQATGNGLVAGGRVARDGAATVATGIANGGRIVGRRMRAAASVTPGAVVGGVKAHPYATVTMVALPAAVAAGYKYSDQIKNTAMSAGASTALAGVQAYDAAKAHPRVIGGVTAAGVAGAAAVYKRDAVARGMKATGNGVVSVAKATPGAIKASAVYTRDAAKAGVSKAAAGSRNAVSGVANVAKATPSALKTGAVYTRDAAKAHPYIAAATLGATALGTYVYRNGYVGGAYDAAKNWWSGQPTQDEPALSPDEEQAVQGLLASIYQSYVAPHMTIKKTAFGATFHACAERAFASSLTFTRADCDSWFGHRRTIPPES